MTGRRLELASGAVLLGFALALWFWLIPVYDGSGEQLLLPRLVALLTGGLALLVLGATLLQGAPAGAQDDDPFIELGGGEPPALVALAVVWGVFCLGLDLFGFDLGGALALPLSFLLLGVRRPVAMLGWTPGTLVSLYAVFELGFRLPLPRGAIERMIAGG